MAGRVEDIQFDRRDIIGWGPTGTIVIRGTWGSDGCPRPVAVKRFLTRQLKMDNFEFDLYRKSEHPNIIQLHKIASSDKGFT